MKDFIEKLAGNISEQIEQVHRKYEAHQDIIRNHQAALHELEHAEIGLRNQQLVCKAILTQMKEPDNATDPKGQDPDQADIGGTNADTDIHSAVSEHIPSGPADQ